MPKITREKFKTLKNVFDTFTERNIFKLISQGYFDGLESPIFIGKEANLFTAIKGKKKVVVKIYRLQTCDFNRMYDYIKYDPRFPNVRKQRRKTIFAWAQREYRNLLKAREAGIRVPTPITCMHNILVMEFIGNEEPAPKLKDAVPKNAKKFFNETHFIPCWCSFDVSSFMITQADRNMFPWNRIITIGCNAKQKYFGTKWNQKHSKWITGF